MAVVCHVARDPIDALTVLSEEISSRFGKTDGIQYDPDLNWEPDIHKLLNIAPEYAQTEFWPLWDRVVGYLRAQGLKVGPFSFHAWKDGDAGLVRATWTLFSQDETVNLSFSRVEQIRRALVQ